MPKHKTDSASATANLIRVRNNQRRSRARRREYVAELERKIHECEAGGVPTRSRVLEDMVRRLQDENKKLRDLLQQAGVEQDTVERHLKESGGIMPQQNVGEVATSAGLQLPAWTPVVSDAGVPEGTDLLQAATAPLPDFTDEMLAKSFLNLPGDDIPGEDLELVFDTTQEAPAFDYPGMPLEPSPSAMCTAPSASIPTEPPMFFCSQSSLPSTSQCDTGTTLCSEAYEMLRQHNKKGIDMIEIGIRLWNGFTKGDERGCKVDNKLLFSVLEYISG
ncbi:hypothetical protein BKA64DRAFT_153787 [Cadophora sp. MPI-SDFR-AT-0126]|nr:hypothetical protein BKA64DRAFT_153787 [Leotiomycetes sp. MPI-SDFR-AT-0126]